LPEVDAFKLTNLRRDSAFAHKFSAERSRRIRSFEVLDTDKLKRVSARCALEIDLLQFQKFIKRRAS
jgi:hypothetical protein